MWTNIIIETPEDKEVFTSLLKAGLVNQSGKGRDSGVGLTEKGFKAYMMNKKSESI